MINKIKTMLRLFCPFLVGRFGISTVFANSFALRVVQTTESVLCDAPHSSRLPAIRFANRSNKLLRVKSDSIACPNIKHGKVDERLG